MAQQSWEGVLLFFSIRPRFYFMKLLVYHSFDYHRGFNLWNNSFIIVSIITTLVLSPSAHVNSSCDFWTRLLLDFRTTKRSQQKKTGLKETDVLLESWEFCSLIDSEKCLLTDFLTKPWFEIATVLFLHNCFYQLEFYFHHGSYSCCVLPNFKILYLTWVACGGTKFNF